MFGRSAKAFSEASETKLQITKQAMVVNPRIQLHPRDKPLSARITDSNGKHCVAFIKLADCERYVLVWNALLQTEPMQISIDGHQNHYEYGNVFPYRAAF